MSYLCAGFLVIGLVMAGLLGWRLSDHLAATRAWRALEATAESAPPRFDPAMTDGLPEPARRFFLFAIAPGTPLRRVAEFRMTGEIGLGDRKAPGYRPMQARQILSFPHGFVWRLRTGPLSGSDGATADRGWTRFWLAHLLPVARAGGTEDYRLSAFGRTAAEALFWLPASYLPGPGISWEAVDADRARATLHHAGMKQGVTLEVDRDGAPVRVIIDRWSNANPESVWQRQPFGGDLSDFREVEGYRIPFRVEGGNHIGTEDYFAFYKAEITEFRYLSD